MVVVLAEAASAEVTPAGAELLAAAAALDSLGQHSVVVRLTSTVGECIIALRAHGHHVLRCNRHASRRPQSHERLIRDRRQSKPVGLR